MATRFFDSTGKYYPPALLVTEAFAAKLARGP